MMKWTCLKSGFLVSAAVHATVFAAGVLWHENIRRAVPAAAGKHVSGELIILPLDDIGSNGSPTSRQSAAAPERPRTPEPAKPVAQTPPLKTFVLEDLPPFNQAEFVSLASKPPDFPPSAKPPQQAATHEPATANPLDQMEPAVNATGGKAEPETLHGTAVEAGTARQARYLINPEPLYPRRAVQLNQQGLVVVALEVTRNGLPLHVRLGHSSGFDLLDEAALKAVGRWRFAPALKGDEPVASEVEIPIHFKLTQYQ